MPTVAAPVRIGSTSRVGTIDPMGKSRVYTDDTLREVKAGDPSAAFVWKRGDLEARRARRAELGLDTHDEALRAQIDSRKVETAKAERRAALLNAEVEELRAAIREKTAAAASGDADDADGSGSVDPADHTRDELVAMAEERGLDTSGTKADLAERLNAG